MASNFQITTAAQNAACDSVVDLLDAGDSAPEIRVYDGTQPADANTALSGNTLLATFTLNATAAFGAAASGVATLADTPINTTAVATGTATFFRAVSVNSGTPTTVFDGSVGTSDADMILNTTSIVTDVSVSLTSGTVTMPAN